MEQEITITEQLKKIICDYQNSKAMGEKSQLEKADDLYNKLLSEGKIQKKSYSQLDKEEAFLFYANLNGYA